MKKTYFILLILLGLSAIAFTQSDPVGPSHISTAIYFDEIPSLKDLPTADEQYYIDNWGRNVGDGVEHESIEAPNYANWKYEGPDPVWQKENGWIENSRGLIQNFQGQSSPYLPSDANGTVGPNHYMQTVNTTFAIYDKSGNLLAGPTAMNTLFSGVPGSENNDGDPLILYDEQVDRWLAVEFSLDAYIHGGSDDYMLFAVSQTGDPTGAWYRYSFVMNGLPDYEKVGIWHDGYYMGTNLGSTTSSGDDVYVFERSAMLTGAASPQMVGFNNPARPNNGFHCIMPLDADGAYPPTASPGQFITINDNAWGGSDEIRIYELDVNWTTPASSTFAMTQQIPVTQFDSQFNAWGVGDIAQSGTSQKVAAQNYTLMTRGQYKNWGSNQTIVCCHTVDVDNSNHAGQRWYELEKTSQTDATWAIRQEGTYAPDAHSRFNGSIAINGSHQIALGYNISSSSMSPNIRYVGQTAASNALANGTMDIAESPNMAQLTPQSQTSSNRWGDYPLMTVDPSDELTFWFTNEYYSSGKKTQIMSFTIDELALTANFSGTPTTICTGGTVNFTDASTGGATSWTWSFPGGSPSSYVGQNPPAITYSTPGSYNVSLEVGDGSTTDTETKTNYITVNNITADFSGAPTTTAVGNTVSFTDASSCSPTSWAWSFSPSTVTYVNGTSAAHQNPDVTFDAAGTYTVSLTATNANGSDTETKVNYITAIYSSSSTYTSGDIPTDYGFDLPTESSSCPGTMSVTIPAGAIITGVDVSYNMTASSSANAWMSEQRSELRCVSSGGVAEGAVYSGSGNSSGTQSYSRTGLTIANGVSGGGSIDFELHAGRTWGGSGCNTTYNYVVNGSWTVTVHYTPGVVDPPVADFIADDVTPFTGQTVSFTDLSSNTPTSWSWSFNPSTVTYVSGNSSSQNPGVTFDAAGTYTVSLTATNSQGSDTETKVNYITASVPPTPGLWTGVVSMDWDTPGNWDDNLVPVAGTDVTIPGVAPHMPARSGDLILGTHCNSITMQGSSELAVDGDLSIPSGYTFTNNANSLIVVTGDMTAEGTFIPGTGTVKLDEDFDAVVSAGSATTPGSLTTTFVGGNGSNGNMFDIVALNDVTIENFEMNLDGGSNDVYIYYKYGTYVGSETNSGDWTFVGSTTVTSTGNGSGTAIPISVGVTIPTGETYAFYIYSALGNAYTNGSAAGNVYVQDSYIQILEGCGKGAPLFTGGTYSPRVFNGVVHYTYGSGGAGSIDYYDLTINKDSEAYVELDADVNVAHDLIVEPGAYLTNNAGKILSVTGDVYLNGSSSNKSSFVDWGTTNVTGEVYAQKYYVDGRWHNVSSPVSNALSEVFLGLYLYEHNEPTNTYINLYGLTHDLLSGKGFLLWSTLGNPIINYTGGSLNTGDYSPTLSFTDANTNSTVEATEGWNLVGNAFPSSIDIMGVGYTWSNLDNTIYMYDGTQYAYFNRTMGTGSTGATRYIPSMQGFFVKVNSLSGGALTIPNSVRLHDGQSNYKSDQINDEIRISVSGNGYSDEMMLMTYDGANDHFDHMLDAYKLFGVDEAPQIYTINQNVEMALNTYQEFNEEKVIPIALKVGADGLYQLNFTNIELEDSEMVLYLEDIRDGYFYKVERESEYNFTHSINDVVHRFNLHFTAPNDISSIVNDDLKIFSTANTIFVQKPNMDNAEIEIYNILGELVYKNHFNEELFQLELDESEGHYLVSVSMGEKIISSKVLIR